MFWMRALAVRSTLAIVTTLAALCALGVGAGGASAGEYHVYSCRMPDGSVAPTDGWSPSATGVSVHAEDKCSKGGALVAALSEGVSHPVGADVATWAFNVPTAETLAGATLWRAGNAEGGAVANATYEFWLAGPTQPEAFDSCVYVSGCMKTVGEPEEPLSVANVLVVPTINLGEHLYVNASCGGLQTYKCPSGKGDNNGYAAVVYLYAADLTLEQTSQPEVSNVEGELATASTLSGSADLAFHAEDTGSGVYQAVFTVDGVEVGRTNLDSNGGHCTDVGQTTDGLPAFLYLQPCAPSLNADLPLDTTALSDGTHHLVVSVTNAAGVSTVALDRKITVLNHPASPPKESTTPQKESTPASKETGPTQPSPEGHSPSTTKNEPTIQTSPGSSPNDDKGAPATVAALQVRWSSTARASLAGSYRHAQVAIGRLTSLDGSPIADAQVQVLGTPSFQGAKTHALTPARTAANGSFRVRIPTGTPSSRLTFAYTRPGLPTPAAIAMLRLTVPAHLTLNVTPRTSHAYGTIAFRGKLSGAPLPSGGKQLVLEARTLGGSWRQFQVISTVAHGRYRATYRFRLAGPIDYQFRAVSPHEADFPYAKGASNVVQVHER